MIARICTAMLLVAVIAATPSPVAGAEPEGPACALCEGNTSGGGGISGGSGSSQHWFPVHGTLSCQTASDQCRDCHAFNACHGDWQGGSCTTNHWGCGQTQAALTKFKDTGTEMLAVLAERREFGVHLILDPAAQGYALILDCDGHVVAARVLDEPRDMVS